MAVTEKPIEKERDLQGGGRPPFGGSGGDGGGGREPERTPPPDGYRLGVWLVLASITVMFLTLTTAYIFIQAWHDPIATPSTLWLSTVVLVISSITMEKARRSLRRRLEPGFNRWLSCTMALGLIFLGSQLLSWRQLIASGFYLSSNLHSSLAYIFTALHGLHLIGGLLALTYVTLRARTNWTAVRKRASVDATALYWHFLDGLWVYLFIILFVWQ